MKAMTFEFKVSGPLAMAIKRSSILLFLFAATSSCSSSDQGFADIFPASTAANYFKRAENVTVEVYYEPGAEPFEGNIGATATPLWDITESNVVQIFSFRSAAPMINLPKALSEMNQIPAQNRTSWTPEQVIGLFNSHHTLKPTTTSAVFYIYFLNGFSSGGPNVIGFSINTTPVIAIFKDVVLASSPTLNVQKFVEQSTIVHELGHAFGLVNNGIPMAAPHQDTANGAHTTNSNCVMYWLNEGSSDLRDFVLQFISSGETEMWGPEVLADVQAFSE